MARKRNPRVDRIVRDAVADLLRTEVADPRLAFVTITEVDVTPDHDVATVYYTTLDPGVITRDARRAGGDRLPAATEVAQGLEAATPRLRSLVGARARLRTTPELRFRPDPVAEQADRVESLLRGLAPSTDADPAGAAPEDAAPEDAAPDADGPRS